MSREVVSGSAFSVSSIFSERAGSALAELEDTQIAASAGTGNNIQDSFDLAIANGDATAPYTAPMALIAHATSSVLVYEDVPDIYYAIPDPDRDVGVWFANPLVCKLLGRVVDANGRPLFLPADSAPFAFGDSPGQRGSIMRRPLFEVPMAEDQLVFLDPSKFYTFVTSGGPEVDVGNPTTGTTDVWRWLVTLFIGGDVTGEDGSGAASSADLTSAA